MYQLVTTSGQDRERLVGDDVDRVVVDLADFLDRSDVGLHVRAVALARGCTRRSTSSAVNGVPSWKLDVLAQLEAPHGRRGLLPLGGERRHELELLAAADQRLVDVAGEAELEGLVQRMRVHRQRVALVRELEGLRLRRGTTAAPTANRAPASRTDSTGKRTKSRLVFIGAPSNVSERREERGAWRCHRIVEIISAVVLEPPAGTPRFASISAPPPRGRSAGEGRPRSTAGRRSG